ncbi:leukocyte surface antigen CD53-like [Centruroides sculpturatus]|uniref:leukocyte surface antigen CD53-like n=1 Tax=Centruroides sculpturatus TaxID=218467 RepID=UPI000C6E721C|nr:leukocyte surface antigen CD53-like [Centruroides sculpturatus]
MGKGEQEAILISDSLVYFFNGLHFIGGSGLFVIGYMTMAFLSKNYIFDEDIKTDLIAIFIMITGGAIVVFTAFSFFAVYTNNLSIMRMCCVVLGWILIVQLEAGIILYVKKNEAKNLIKANMFYSFKTYSSNNTNRILWDKLHKNKECCAVTGYFDWISRSGNIELPKSCCKSQSLDKCIASMSQQETIFETGCYDKIMMDVNYRIKLFEINNSTVVVIGLESILFGLLYVRIKNNMPQEERSESFETEEEESSESEG